MYLYVTRDIDFASFYDFFLLCFVNVPTVFYLFHFYFIFQVYIYLCQPEDLDNFKSLDLPEQSDNSDDSCDYINKNVVKHYNSYNSEESDSPILWWVR